MARSRLALAALVCSLLAAFPAGAGAATRHTARRSACAASRRAHARNKSFRRLHCPTGKSRRTSRSGGGSTGQGGSSSALLFFTARDGQCPDAGLAPSTSNVEQVRAATLCLVNRERSAHGEPALRWNVHLVAAAQAHTESMAFGGYFEHVSPNGETPASRMRKAGYIYSSQIGYEVGENIAWGSLWLGTPKAVVAAWMASPGHRANILDARFRETGIGVSPHLGALAPGQPGGIYTQDFGVLIG